MKRQGPNPTERLLYIGVAVVVILLLAGALSGVFYVSESTPVPSGSAVQTDAFLPGPYLSISWNCPTGFTCPSTSFPAYGHLPGSAILPPIPKTGLLYTAALVPVSITLVVALWFLIVLYPGRTEPRTHPRPSPRLLGIMGALTIATVTWALLLTPALLAADLASSNSGVPSASGPWNSISGSSHFGHLTLTWGPAAGFYLILAAGVLLVCVAALRFRRFRNMDPT
ncbi:MAG: hypothetical protein ACYCPN_00285 [Thermoplasmata archaeon]